MAITYCERHPDVPAVCDLAFPACPLCEMCRIELEKKNGFDRTIPLKNEEPETVKEAVDVMKWEIFRMLRIPQIVDWLAKKLK